MEENTNAPEMVTIRFTKWTGYMGSQYQRGEVEKFEPKHARALVSMGNAELVATAETKQEATTKNDEQTTDESSDADQQPAGANVDGDDDLKCPKGCNGGKPFPSAAALAAHRAKKSH